MCNLNIWASFGCQLLITIPSWCSDLQKLLHWTVLPTHSKVSCLQKMQVFLLYFQFTSLVSGPCAVSSMAETTGNVALWGQVPWNSKSCPHLPLINEFRWRETGPTVTLVGSLYQPPLLSAREGFGPTSYKFWVRLSYQAKAWVSLLWEVVLWCWIWHSSAIASYRHIINALTAELCESSQDDAYRKEKAAWWCLLLAATSLRWTT